jgi:glycosyltransferase involved in cell wall biosynthesis/SAM-dependent methyltransferase
MTEKNALMSTELNDFNDSETLRYLWSPELDGQFSREGRVGVASAWYGHVPFAHWLIGAAKPRTLVELGTHNGVSYSAFCEAVMRNELVTRCYAVDTWQGDDQAGHYGDEVYIDLRRFHDERYGAFSELLRCTFDEAVPFFREASVDLLHIDGLHTYEAVAHDFERWRQKLSDTAVVLFHDTNVKQGDFGVWKLWEELRAHFPSFEFLHEHGLGLLGVGSSIPSTVLDLCSLRDPLKVHAIRQRFAFLGQRWQLLAQRDVQHRALEARIQSLEKEEAVRQTRIHELEAELAKEETVRQTRIHELEAESARRTATERQLRANTARRAAQLRAELATTRAGGVGKRASTNRVIEAATDLSVLFISGEPDTPGNIYRVVRQVEAANAAGARASWMRLDEVPARCDEIAVADIVVMWRTAWDERVEAAVDGARRGGARLVFDVDDLMVNPEIARFDIIDGIRTNSLTEQQVSEHFKRLHTTMLAADYCTAPTEELAGNIRQFFRPAMVLPNGFDRMTYKVSRNVVRRRRSQKSDGLVRIGYAGGSRTHQRDFALAAQAVARVLRERPHCRLVLFRSADGSLPTLDIEEFSAFQEIENQIEWQNFVPLPELPKKIGHFDVNLAPLEVGNAFCEAKSELKFFEAALVDVPTIASPTGPYRRAIRNGVTGFLPGNSEEWYSVLVRLVDDQELRYRVARAAHRAVLWRYGPLRRAESMLSALPQLHGNSRDATRAFALDLQRATPPNTSKITVADTEILFSSDQFGDAEVTVVIPLYNYAHYVEEALESVRAQTLEVLDLIVVDDASTDFSVSVALKWAQSNAKRFNRIIVLRNKANAGLGIARNTGIDAADTPFVLLLDADNKLRPECSAVCLSAILANSAAFAYPLLQQFGDTSDLMGNCPFEPGRLIGGNYIDALALVSKEAWAAVDGYRTFRIMGWEDFDFWCRLVEIGLWGCRAGDSPLAEYRVHGNSMLRTTTSTDNCARQLIAEMEDRYTWLRVIDRPRPKSPIAAPLVPSGLHRFLPILRCPETGQVLEIEPDGVLRTGDGSRSWPVIEGRPNLFPGLMNVKKLPESHLSNPLPDSALDIIREAADGLVLNLSAGGTSKKLDNVVEAEASIFRHTDVLADAHRLPFADGAFDAVIVMNAFEHYREPKCVAKELFRVLRPGGKLLVRTAFLQPLHEKPWHFYNCTRYGLEEWFKDFKTEELHVSSNFSPGHSISWLASECELALLRELSSSAADAFGSSSLSHLISLWRATEETRSTDAIWSSLAQLPQEVQESIAAGFEYVGRRPLD